MNKTIIFAHRGVSQFAPENTLPAFELAFSMNCPGIEFDVQLTKDGIPVIVHDETLDRTSNGSGYIKDFTLSQLKNFDVGQKFSSKFQGTTIPSLEEFLNLAKKKNYKGIINVELKNDIVKYPNIEEKVLTLLNSYDFHDQILISSFNYDSISKIRKLSPQSNLALLYEGKKPPCLNALKEVRAISANIEFNDFSKALFEELHKNNLRIMCYTINSKEELAKYIIYGVDGIFTNNPQLGMEILKSREP